MTFDWHVVLEVKINEIVIPIEFYVTKNLPMSVLLGWSWIEENDVIIRPTASIVSTRLIKC